MTLPVYPATKAALTMLTVQYAKALPACRPSEFDAVLVVEEPPGVLLASNRAPNLTGPKGIRLDALAGMDWVSSGMVEELKMPWRKSLKTTA